MSAAREGRNAPKKPAILALNIDKAEAFIAGPDDVCISIRSPGCEPARLSPNFRAVHRLYFHDLAGISTPWPKGSVQFTADDAERLADFLHEHRETAKRIVVHCEAGASRSVAIALAISTAWYRYWAYPPQVPAEYRRQRYVHNRYVFDTLRAALSSPPPEPSL